MAEEGVRESRGEEDGEETREGFARATGREQQKATEEVIFSGKSRCGEEWGRGVRYAEARASV